MKAFCSHMTSQSKNTEAKQQPDLPWAENTEKSHNQLKKSGS